MERKSQSYRIHIVLSSFMSKGFVNILNKDIGFQYIKFVNSTECLSSFEYHFLNLKQANLFIHKQNNFCMINR